MATDTKHKLQVDDRVTRAAARAKDLAPDSDVVSVELSSRRTGMSFQRTRMSADRTLIPHRAFADHIRVHALSVLRAPDRA